MKKQPFYLNCPNCGDKGQFKFIAPPTDTNFNLVCCSCGAIPEYCGDFAGDDLPDNVSLGFDPEESEESEDK